MTLRSRGRYAGSGRPCTSWSSTTRAWSGHTCGGCCGRGADEAVVQDLFQETFLGVHRGLPRFSPTGPARLSTWILAIATRVALNHLRQRRRDQPAEAATIGRRSQRRRRGRGRDGAEGAGGGAGAGPGGADQRAPGHLPAARVPRSGLRGDRPGAGDRRGHRGLPVEPGAREPAAQPARAAETTEIDHDREATRPTGRGDGRRSGAAADPRTSSTDRAGDGGAGRTGVRPAGDASRPAGRRRLWPVAAALAAGVVAWRAGLGDAAVRRGGGFSAGHDRPTAQETIRHRPAGGAGGRGGRAAALADRAGQGAVLVDQTAGEVFYRVNARPFVVQTPSGVVRVTGTCFRVEVSDMKLINRQNLSGRGDGRGPGRGGGGHGVRGARAAGQEAATKWRCDRGRARQMTASGVAATVGGGSRGWRALTGASRASPASTRPRRCGRASPTRRKSWRSCARLGAVAKKIEESKKRILDPSKQELLARADRCEIRWDTPNIKGVNEKDRVRLGLSETEDAGDERGDERDQGSSGAASCAPLYVELTGDATTAEKLAPQTMQSEIFAKRPRGRAAAGPPATVARTGRSGPGTGRPVEDARHRAHISRDDRASATATSARWASGWAPSAPGPCAR